MKQRKAISSPRPIVGQRPARRGRWRKRIFTLFFLVFVIGGIFFGGVFAVRFRQVMMIVSEKLDLPVNIISNPDNTPDWKGKERVNILLLGVDQRPEEAGIPARTDTMLVLTIDPYGKTAGLLSIPRDLWVPVPIADNREVQERINAANVLGETSKYPGGGPALAKKTVELLLGVKIHYYARVDFEGFMKIVDTLGGIDVDVPRPLKDDEYPGPNYSTTRIYIPAGLQHLDSQGALQYARSRHQDSDLGRNQRQEQVLLGIRQRALELNLLPKLPELFSQLRGSVKTDLALNDLLALAKLGKDIDPNGLTTAAIGYDAVTPTTFADGAEVLLPNRAAIRTIVAQVFFDPRLREENAKVEVLNGTSIQGLATKVATSLKDRGLANVTVDNTTDRHDYTDVSIINYTGKKYTASLIASVLGVTEQQIESRDDPTSTVDIRIILGTNTRVPN